MKQKEMAISQIVWYTFDKQPDETYIDCMSNFEICLILYGLLSYTTIENDLQMAALSAAIVDILYECGFVEKILSFCKKDYERLCKMADRAVNFRTGLELITTISTFDSQQLQTVSKELKNTIGNLKPEMIENMVKFAQMNDPITIAVTEALDKYGILKSKEEIKDKMQE